MPPRARGQHRAQHVVGRHPTTPIIRPVSVNTFTRMLKPRPKKALVSPRVHHDNRAVVVSVLIGLGLRRRFRRRLPPTCARRAPKTTAARPAGLDSRVLTAALRDLQWRRRRFIIAVVGTAFVFAMTLVLTGLANGFRVEARNTVDAFGIDYFLIQNGAVGPFPGLVAVRSGRCGSAQRLPGVQSAAGLVYAGITALDNGTPGP